jgi:hypothetical protein
MNLQLFLLQAPVLLRAKMAVLIASNGPPPTMPEKPVRGQCPRWASRIVQVILALVFLVALFPAPAKAETPTSIDMKLLVISADGNETVFAGIKSILNQIGIPYDALIASETPLTAQTLSDGLGAGRYQGILLATGNLGYEASPGVYESALTSAQWQMLWQYEADFRVRQVTLYTYPGGAPDNYGLIEIAAADTNSNPIQATLTAAGQQLFGYLNAANPISIKSAWTYLATPVSSTNPVPLLTTANGYAIVSIYAYPDGRENLTITTDGNSELTHTLLLGYGVVNWVSKGFFLGERKVYLNAQSDDVLLDDDLWDVKWLSGSTGLSYRMTGTDYKRVIAWQKAVRASNTNAAQIRLEMSFNGAGASGIYPKDTLTPAVRNDPNQFKWISHTYTHALLTDISYGDALTELNNNDKVAQQLKFQLYSKDSMIQPEISGLNNPEFLRAAKDYGIRDVLSDSSRPGWNSPSPNTGFYSTYEPSILIIPRYPTNLYYNVSTPAEWVSEYNYFYAPGGLFPTWDRALTYSEILDKESEIWIRYLLKYNLNPVMFHQSNLRSYTNKNSLLGDLINATLNKFNSMYKLPIRSPSQHDAGVLMAARMAYNASGVSGRILLGTTNSISLKTVSPVNVPLTGINYGSSKESYGGQTISTISLGANGAATIPAPVW